MVEMVAFSQVDRSLPWSLTFYILDSVSTPLTDVLPKRVSATKRKATYAFWPPKRKPRAPPMRNKQAKTATKPAVFTLQSFLDGFEDQGSDDEGAAVEDPEEDQDIAMDAEDPEVEELFFRMEAMQALESMEGAETAEQRETTEPKQSTQPPVPIASGDAAGNIAAPSAPSADPAAAPVADDGAEVAGRQPVAADPKAKPRPQRRGAGGGEQGGRSLATCSVSIGEGAISYYANRRSFQATCHEHPNCNVTRVGLGGVRSARCPARGRPLGMMAAFLLSAKKPPHERPTRPHCRLFHMQTDAMSEGLSERNHLAL